MPLGESYLDAIRKFEGWNPRPYWDHKQWSVGYGTRGQPGEVIDRAEGERRLNAELTSARDRVRGLGVTMTPGQEAALTSLTYNAGPGWMNSGLGGAVRAGNWDDARSRFLQYVNASGRPNQGLINRRNQEAMWLTGGDSAMVQPSMMPDVQPGPRQQSGQQGGVFAPMGAGYFDRLMTNPAFLAGLSILGTQPGGNWGPAGAQAAQMAVRTRMAQSEFERLQQQRATRQRAWDEAFPNGQPNPNHPLTRSVPPELLASVYAMGPEAGLPLLGKFSMTGSLERLKLELQQQLRQQQIAQLERLFTGGQPPAQTQPEQPPAAGPDPFAAPATVMPPAASAGPGVAVQPPTGGQQPPQTMMPPQAPPAAAPQPPPQQSSMPPILSTPGVRESMLGSVIMGDPKGAFDAYNQEVGRRRAPQVAGETARQQERAKLDAARPQARASVANALDSLGRMEAEARAIHDDPALSRITGLFGQMPDITGGAAADVRARLKSLVSQIGFSTLQAMREASKTGGALGSVSERELEALQNAIAGLDTKQSTASFQRALMQVMEYSRKARARLTGSYRDTYGEDFGEVPRSTVFPTRPERKTLGKKKYIKIDGQWFQE